jgi:hypothetical protein
MRVQPDVPADCIGHRRLMLDRIRIGVCLSRDRLGAHRICEADHFRVAQCRAAELDRRFSKVT